MGNSRRLGRSRARRGNGYIEPLERRLLFAVFNVNSTVDILSPAPGVVTLRSAIQATNATPGANTINLTLPGIYKITIAGPPGATNNASGEFAILPNSTSLAIDNTSGGDVTVDANHLDRAFDINPNASTKAISVTMQGFTIENGQVTDALHPDGPNASGGGIRDQGNASLTLIDMNVTGNSASADGGGVAMENTVSAPWTLTLNNTTLSNNHAGDAGGGLETDGSGTVGVNSGSVISGNSSLNQGGGIWLEPIAVGKVLQSAALNLNGVLVRNNTASSSLNFGGGIGTGGNGAVAIANSTVSSNFSAGVGGGFADQGGQASLTIDRSLFTNNSATGDGGGIYQNGPSTSITSSQFQNNTTAGHGGGIFVSSIILSIQRSSIAHNTAALGGGGAEIQTTGSVFLGSAITDSTFTGNKALNNQGGTNGGGIDAPSAFTGTLELLNDTVNANLANNGGGIFWAGAAGSSLSLGNTIVAGNSANTGPDANNPAATFSDLGGNLIGISGAGGGNTGFVASGTRTGTVISPLDPQLSSLTNNGGPLVGAPAEAIVLQTEAPSPAGPAFGKAKVALAPAVDERGFPSVVNGLANVGAVSNGAGSIAGSVFNDANYNGARDSGEAGLPGVTVYLDANNNGVLDPGEIRTTTDASGNYIFHNLPPGTYIVREVDTSGWARTTPLSAGPTVNVVSAQTAAGPVFGDVQVSTVTMNFAYLVLLARHYGQPDAFADGDLNGDGTVGFDDLVILARNYNHKLPVLAAAPAVSASTTLAPSFIVASRPASVRMRGYGHG